MSFLLESWVQLYPYVKEEKVGDKLNPKVKGRTIKDSKCKAEFF